MKFDADSPLQLGTIIAFIDWQAEREAERQEVLNKLTMQLCGLLLPHTKIRAFQQSEELKVRIGLKKLLETGTPFCVDVPYTGHESHREEWIREILAIKDRFKNNLVVSAISRDAESLILCIITLPE